MYLKKTIYACLKYPLFLLFRVPWFSHKILKLLRLHKANERLRLSHGFISEGLSRILMKIWVELIYLKEIDPAKREKLKQSLLGEEPDVIWANHYLTKMPPLEVLINFSSIGRYMVEIKNILGNGKDFVVFQIGCSSGREIAYLAKNYPEISFFGTDISDEVIKFCREKQQIDNLRFDVSPATDIAKMIEKYPGKNILLFSSGALQYVEPEYLDQMFKNIRNFKSLVVVFFEFGNTEKGLPSNIKGSLHWHEFLYTHNYKYYAEKQGFKTIECCLERCTHGDHQLHKKYDNNYDERKHDPNSINYLYIGRTNFPK